MPSPNRLASGDPATDLPPAPLALHASNPTNPPAAPTDTPPMPPPPQPHHATLPLNTLALSPSPPTTPSLPPRTPSPSAHPPVQGEAPLALPPARQETDVEGILRRQAAFREAHQSMVRAASRSLHSITQMIPGVRSVRRAGPASRPRGPTLFEWALPGTSTRRTARPLPEDVASYGAYPPVASYRQSVPAVVPAVKPAVAPAANDGSHEVVVPVAVATPNPHPPLQASVAQPLPPPQPASQPAAAMVYEHYLRTRVPPADRLIQLAQPAGDGVAGPNHPATPPQPTPEQRAAAAQAHAEFEYGAYLDSDVRSSRRLVPPIQPALGAEGVWFINDGPELGPNHRRIVERAARGVRRVWDARPGVVDGVAEPDHPAPPPPPWRNTAEATRAYEVMQLRPPCRLWPTEGAPETGTPFYWELMRRKRAIYSVCKAKCEKGEQMITQRRLDLNQRQIWGPGKHRKDIEALHRAKQAYEEYKEERDRELMEFERDRTEEITRWSDELHALRVRQAEEERKREMEAAQRAAEVEQGLQDFERWERRKNLRDREGFFEVWLGDELAVEGDALEPGVQIVNGEVVPERDEDDDGGRQRDYSTQLERLAEEVPRFAEMRGERLREAVRREREEERRRMLDTVPAERYRGLLDGGGNPMGRPGQGRRLQPGAWRGIGEVGGNGAAGDEAVDDWADIEWLDENGDLDWKGEFDLLMRGE